MGSFLPAACSVVLIAWFHLDCDAEDLRQLCKHRQNPICLLQADLKARIAEVLLPCCLCLLIVSCPSEEEEMAGNGYQGRLCPKGGHPSAPVACRVPPLPFQTLPLRCRGRGQRSPQPRRPRWQSCPHLSEIAWILCMALAELSPSGRYRMELSQGAWQSRQPLLETISAQVVKGAKAQKHISRLPCLLCLYP